jgi:hypothetical protein
MLLLSPEDFAMNDVPTPKEVLVYQAFSYYCTRPLDVR